MNTIHHNLNPRHEWTAQSTLGAAFVLAAFLGASSCGGGSSSTPSGSLSCTEEAGRELGGAWHVTGTVLVLDPEVGEYVPNGLDDAVINLQFVHGEQSQGICALLYAGSSASLDTTSPVGGPSTLHGLAASTQPAGVFGLAGLLYFPQGDVTTRLDFDFGSIQPHVDGAFEATIEFEVFDGDQIAAVVDNTPGVDDDGDGQIDEADEFDPGDGIAADAILLCRGSMQLTISRAGALAQFSSGPASVSLSGVLRALDGSISCPTQLRIERERARILFEIDGAVSADRTLRLIAPLDAEGNFVASGVDGNSKIELMGVLHEGIEPQALLRVHGAAAGEQAFRLEPAVNSVR